MQEEDFTLDSLLADVPKQREEVKQAQDQASNKENFARFTAPVTEADIVEKIHGSIPKATRKSTGWAVHTWEVWAENRQKTSAEFPPKLSVITDKQLNYWLSRFVLEVRSKKGEQYQGGTLYSLCAGLQRHIRSQRRSLAVEGQVCDVDIYKDSAFGYFRCVLDSVMKDLHRQGVGNSTKSAEIMTPEMEEEMWKNNILGDDTPRKLIDTLVYCFGLNFAMRSGEEHRNLRPDMLQLVEPPNSAAYLVYTESGSKNRQGELKDRNKVTNKVVKYFANVEDPNRCGVRLYKKYMSLRPSDAPAKVFYLKPHPSYTSGYWYYPQPIGHNVLRETVKRLCSTLGKEGHYTNHSLRRTCATRLFQEGVEEQQIMSITGHRSTKAVRLYKEVSHEQQEETSKIIQNAKKFKAGPSTSISETGATFECTAKTSMTVSDKTRPVFNFHSCSVVFQN